MPLVRLHGDRRRTTGTPTGNTIDYAGKAETSSTINRDLANVRFANDAPSTSPITHYYDDATATTGAYTVNAGDPLLQNRFSLAKINWLSQSWAGEPDPGTLYTASSYAGSKYPAAIQACFGLTWGTVGAANGGNPCWSYVGSPAGPSGNIVAFNGTIETLDQVAKEGREPNFFELLKAAILSGSLGQNPGLCVYTNGNDVSTSYNLHNGGTNTGAGRTVCVFV